MNILEEITKEEFERKFPDIPAHDLKTCSPVFLENGVILINSEWNGERYITEGKEYTPFYKEGEQGDIEIIGYYEF